MPSESGLPLDYWMLQLFDYETRTILTSLHHFPCTHVSVTAGALVHKPQISFVPRKQRWLLMGMGFLQACFRVRSAELYNSHAQ
jgi:hypothetical protein